MTRTVDVQQDPPRVAARVVAAVGAVFWGLFWFGIIDLLVVVQQDERFHDHYLFESGWGLLYLVLVTVPLVLLAIRPGEPVALAQLGVVTSAVLIGALWRGSWPQTWNALGLALTVSLLAWLGRGHLPQWRRPDLALSVLALFGLPAAVAYGAPLVANTTEVEDITNEVSHYPMQASLALAVVALVALAAVTAHPLPAWTAAFSACWLGVESIVYPDLRASLGAMSGAVAIAWGVSVVLAVELERRHVTPDEREPLAPIRTAD